MASTRETVLEALHQLLIGVGGADVKRNYALPSRIGDNGLVILRDGTPGEPESSLSPLTYFYQHEASLEVIVQDVDRQDKAFDALCVAIGQRLAIDRTLSGLCDWVEASAPEPTDLVVEGGEPIKGAALTITLHYATTTPI